ncbi:hypothetical protein BDN67DRAFT_976193 [Paxillus ammoniavirescens]|nr:hypothetical protein BDN67DRAFT_976193 [Paxillus ammoniavirescens]
MFLVRTYALWNPSKATLVIIAASVTVRVFRSYCRPSVFFNSALTVIPVSGITNCDDVSQSRIAVWANIILVIWETGGKSRLLSILVHHNPFYFCCTSSVTVIATTVFFPDTCVDLIATCLSRSPYSVYRRSCMVYRLIGCTVPCGNRTERSKILCILEVCLHRCEDGFGIMGKYSSVH